MTRSKKGAIPTDFPEGIDGYVVLRKSTSKPDYGTWQLQWIVVRPDGKRGMRATTFSNTKIHPTYELARRAADGIILQSRGLLTKQTIQEHCRQSRKRIKEVSISWYERALKVQGGACGICGRIPNKLVIDHCHDTGNLRGLLCAQCNVGIGMLRDDVVVLRKAVAYLEEHGQ